MKTFDVVNAAMGNVSEEPSEKKEEEEKKREDLHIVTGVLHFCCPSRSSQQSR